MVLQPNPVPVVQIRALVAPEQEGTASHDAVVVAAPKIVFAVCAESVNVSAGVLVDVATEVVNRGERLPAEKEVTVPPPPPEEHVAQAFV